MRTLVVYYSLGGTTRKVAESMAKALGADLAEVRCTRYGRGAVDFLKACYDSLTSRLPQIEVAHAPAHDYDLVLAGAPIWAGHIATPMRAYLNDHRGQFKRVAFFLTYGGSFTERALAEMSSLAAVAPQSTLALRTADVLGGHTAALDRFAQSLKLKIAA